MKKIIFLDFDGVLNTEYYQNYLMSKREQWQDGHGAFFDPEAVQQLKRIIEATNADIVIESSWKYLGFEAMQNMWKERNLPGRVMALQILLKAIICSCQQTLMTSTLLWDTVKA